MRAWMRVGTLVCVSVCVFALLPACTLAWMHRHRYACMHAPPPPPRPTNTYTGVHTHPYTNTKQYVRCNQEMQYIPYEKHTTRQTQIVVVEWNPLPGRASLAEELKPYLKSSDTPEATHDVSQVRVITVPPSFHDKVSVCFVCLSTTRFQSVFSVCLSLPPLSLPVCLCPFVCVSACVSVCVCVGVPAMNVQVSGETGQSFFEFMAKNVGARRVSHRHTHTHAHTDTHTHSLTCTSRSRAHTCLAGAGRVRADVKRRRDDERQYL